MTNVGWIGLGKLGLPCALTLANYHKVVGYDVSDLPARILAGEVEPPQERGIRELLETTSLRLVESVAEVVAVSEVVFVAVQTPHGPSFGGERPMPVDRQDFEYAFLEQAVRDVAEAARQRGGEPVTVVVVSTALPGTFNHHLRHLINPFVNFVYNPFFIAMGTTVEDFLNPEFVLIGADDPDYTDVLFSVYRAIHHRDIFVTSIETAELTKVAYNTFISMKIVFANMLMEIAQKTGADCDRVIDALSLGVDRIVSPAYMRGGMGDGGACHPRDLIAMSWLSERLDLSVDLMGYLARARERQTAWLASLVDKWVDLTGLRVVVLGRSYKPESDLTYGSPALLLLSILEDRDYEVCDYDPFVDGPTSITGRALYVIATKHFEFSDIAFERGSVVLDPFGYIPDCDGVTVVRIGRKS